MDINDAIMLEEISTKPGPKAVCLVGTVFNRWKVLARAPNRVRAVMWTCQCDCGEVRDVRATTLKNEASKSCGCLRLELLEGNNRRTTHGLSHSPLYLTWMKMKDRCFNNSSSNYRYYGGRGITVCEEWLEFSNFLSYMGDRPDRMTLDRIDNEGNYCPENCRWATWKQQMSNRRGAA